MERMTGTYYEILGVPRDAPDREIKQAYLILARRFHPDVCREEDAEGRFKRINEAYQVLSDAGERARYDAMGHDTYLRHQAESGDISGSHGPPGFPGFGDAFDLFFPEREWGPAGTFRPASTSDILVRMEITLEEAILGCEKVIEIPYVAGCASCGGTGSATGTARPCSLCGGSGIGGRDDRGDLADPGASPCRECGGKGRIPEEPCIPCGGWGVIRRARRVPVRIPPGIDSGMRIRKEGLGDGRDPGIPGGDLYIEVAILPHDRFTRRGDDLEIPLHISPARAALGSTAGIEMIDGRVIQVAIPAGVQHGAPVRVRGGGVKTREGCGDLIVRIRIDSPEKTTAAERDLYRKLLRIEEAREGLKKGGLLSRYFSRARDTKR